MFVCHFERVHIHFIDHQEHRQASKMPEAPEDGPAAETMGKGPTKGKGPARTAKKNKKPTYIPIQDFMAKGDRFNTTSGAYSGAATPDKRAGMGLTDDLLNPGPVRSAIMAALRETRATTEARGVQGSQHLRDPRLKSSSNQLSLTASDATGAECSIVPAAALGPPSSQETPREALHHPTFRECSPVPPGLLKLYAKKISEGAKVRVETDADENLPETMRPAPQNLRYGAYQGQQAPQSRNTPLGSGRLQNSSKSGA